jgi:hypothetical protein
MNGCRPATPARNPNHAGGVPVMNFVLEMPRTCRNRNPAACLRTWPALAALACSLLAGGCRHRAQEAPVRVPPPPPVGAPRLRNQLAENTIVVASLPRAIGSRLSQDGDVFKARLTSPLLGASGEQIAAKGAAVTGTVVSRVDGLGVRFDAIETVEHPLNVRARLLEIIPKTSMEITNLERDAGGLDVRICPAPGIQRGPKAVDPSNPIARCKGTVYLRTGTKLRLQLFEVRQAKGP